MSYEEYTVKVYLDGVFKWFNLNGQYHHLDGPACEYSNGTKIWYQNGQLHRLDGPACEYSNGNKSWYIEGKHYAEDDFNAQVNPPVDCILNKIVTIDGKEYQLVVK